MTAELTSIQWATWSDHGTAKRPGVGEVRLPARLLRLRRHPDDLQRFHDTSWMGYSYRRAFFGLGVTRTLLRAFTTSPGYRRGLLGLTTTRTFFSDTIM